MKKILLILIIVFLAFDSLAQEMFFGITLPLKNNLNIPIQNGPTPNLQKDVIREKCAPEKNLMEELEAERIKIRATHICA